MAIVAIFFSALLLLSNSTVWAVSAAQKEGLFALNSPPILPGLPVPLPPPSIWTIDPGSGNARLISTLDGRYQSLATSPDGTLFAWDLSGRGLVTIDKFTGVETDVNPSVGSDVFIQSLTFAPDGTLFATESGSGSTPESSLYTVDPATGIAYLVGSTPEAELGNSIRGIEFVENRLVGVAFSFDDSPFFGIDTNDGSVSNILLTGTPQLNSLAKNSAGDLLSVAGFIEAPDLLVSLDTTTGTTLSSVSIDLPGPIGEMETIRAISFAPIPEPATLATVFVWCLVICTARQKNR